MAGAMRELSEANFQEEIKKGITLVDFYADWCGPCRMMTPVLVKAAEEMQGVASIVKLDIDKAQQVASSFQVTSIPTLILFKDGKEVGRIVGLRDLAAIKEFIQSAKK